MPGTRKLGKTSDQRMAMLRQQVTDFLDNGKMETTITRAKEIKPMAEKMITLGKASDLHTKRQVYALPRLIIFSAMGLISLARVMVVSIRPLSRKSVTC